MNLQEQAQNINTQFQQCLEVIAVDANSTNTWPKELISNYVNQFLDAAKQLESSLVEIQNHYRSNSQVGIQKEVANLEAEIIRKDHLIIKYKGKVSEWEASWNEFENVFHG